MIKPKKSLGQNFLKSKAALKTIRDTANPNGLDIILEVGPGTGALTEILLPFPAKIIAIEKDSQLIPVLQEKFRDAIQAGKLEILEQDILDFDPAISKHYNLNQFNYKLVANIPYYITGAILKKFLTADVQPELMVLLLQKEVAKRIVARDKKESLLSLSVKVYGEPKYIETVKAKYFSPAPKVDSAILLIENISKKFFTENNISEEKFFEIIRAGFAHKRKVLISNLKSLFESKKLEKTFEKLSLSKKVRAEDLSLEIWKNLIQELN